MATSAANRPVAERIVSFLEGVSEADNTEAISDAKFGQISVPEQMVVIEEGDRVVAVGVIASHEGPDGSQHWAVETVLESGLRFAAFEDKLLDATLALVPGDAPMSVWSHRPSLDAALAHAGFTLSRTLAYLTLELPIAPGSGPDRTRSFRPSDVMRIVEINRAAFANHREAASLTIAEIEELLSREGFSDEGLRVEEISGEVVGFCWTRVHTNGDGEIYRIAVDPFHQGGGIGMTLLRAGFAHLSRSGTVTRGTLWVDTENSSAMAMYEHIGMVELRSNREFERQQRG